MTLPRAERRVRQLRVPVTQAEGGRIEQNAIAAGLGVAAFLRDVGCGQTPRAAIDQEQVDALLKVNADLGRLGGLLKWWLSDAQKIAVTPVEQRPDIHGTLADIRATQGQLRAVIARLSL